MNLGQSVFQDTHFVAGAQLTPFRKLRQVELELRSIEDSLVKAGFAQRRTELKLSKLDPNDPEQAIDIDEIKWDMAQQEQLLRDAVDRRANFVRLKDEILKSMPQEYWDAGFEAAELEHWTLYITKALTTSSLLGIPDKNAMEQLMLMPQETQDRIMIDVHQNVTTLRIRNEEVLKLALSST